MENGRLGYRCYSNAGTQLADKKKSYRNVIMTKIFLTKLTSPKLYRLPWMVVDIPQSPHNQSVHREECPLKRHIGNYTVLFYGLWKMAEVIVPKLLYQTLS